MLSSFNLFKKRYPGKFILILGPSGSGKGTVIGYLKSNYPNLVFPASYTTRDKRPKEVEGEVYHFITKDAFKAKIKANDFLEWAIVHADNYYGTDKNEIIQNLKKGKNVLREVDIQGVKSIQKLIHPQNIITIFITTDSWTKLEKRIKGRSNISPEELEHRKKSYEKEIKFAKKCNFTVFSEDGQINKTNQEVLDIIKKSI